MRSCLVGFIVLMSMSAPARSQSPPPHFAWPAVGTRVLAIMPPGPDDDRFLAFRLPSRVTGRVTASTADTLFVQPHSGVGVLPMPRAAIRSLYVSRGRSRWRSALSYGATFALVGAFTRAPFDEERSGTSRTDEIFTDAAIGAAGGIVTGLVWPREFWRRAK